MTTLDLYGIGTVALLVLLFYGLRNIRAYVALAAVIVGGFAVATRGYAGDAGWLGWTIMLTGLLLWAFGLVIVRTMLIRSVSLHLLKCIDSGHKDTFGEDIASRLIDMRTFSLVRANESGYELTRFGQLVAGVVAALYSLFRIHA